MAPLAGVADQIFRFDFTPPVDRPRAWLAGQCLGDHVLWIDGDEVPSPALVEALPDLCHADGVVQSIVARRWLFANPGHWLDESPSSSDFQLRLCRNDEASMWFGGTHAPFGFAPPVRFVEAPLYHLSCVVELDRRAPR